MRTSFNDESAISRRLRNFAKIKERDFDNARISADGEIGETAVNCTLEVMNQSSFP